MASDYILAALEGLTRGVDRGLATRAERKAAAARTAVEAEQNQFERGYKEKTLAQSQSQFDAAQALDREKIASQERIAIHGKGADRKDARIQREVQDFVTKNSDLGELSTQFNSVLDYVDPEDANQDIAGVGKTAMLPDFLISSKGKETRQVLAGLKNIVLRARSGGAVTPQEAARLLNEIGDGNFKTDEQLRSGVKRFGMRLKETLKDKEAALSDEGKREYVARRGGLLSERVPGFGSGEKKGGGGREGVAFAGGSPKLPQSERKVLMDTISKNPNHPRKAEIMRLLEDSTD